MELYLHYPCGYLRRYGKALCISSIENMLKIANGPISRWGGGGYLGREQFAKVESISAAGKQQIASAR